MRSLIKDALLIILLTGISIGSYYVGEYSGNGFENRTILTMDLYKDSYIVGNNTGYHNGYIYAELIGNAIGKDNKIQHILDSTKDRIDWK